MCQNLVSISNVYLERCVGQGFHHDTLHFNHVGFCQTLSLLVRINLLAVSRKGFAKLAVGDPGFASDLFRKPVLVRRYKQHVSALLRLGDSTFLDFPSASSRYSPSTARTMKSFPWSRPATDLTMLDAAISMRFLSDGGGRQDLRLAVRDQNGIFIVGRPFAVPAS